MEALGACGANDARVVTTLVEHLNLENRFATLPVFRALLSLGPKAKGAKAALEALVEGDDPWRQVHARHTLVAIEGAHARHVPHIIQALKIKDAGNAVQASARIALAALGAPVVPFLRAAMSDKNAVVRQQVSEILARHER